MDLEKDLSKYPYEILTENYLDYDISFKLIVIGDSGIGKSQLINKAIKKKIDEDYSATVGFEFSTFNIKIKDKICKLQIWDTCGQEVYKSLILNFYRNSSLVILVYSIANISSFQHLENWKNEIGNNCISDTKVILVGNKNDLENEREVSYEDGLNFCKKNQFDYFFESSNITGYNVLNIFIKAAFLLYEDFIQKKNSSMISETSDFQKSISIDPTKTSMKEKDSTCCFFS